MSERLTKSEIQSKYPDQWVLLTDIVECEKTYDIESAVVADSNLDGDEALHIQINTWPKYKAWYTTPKTDNTICIGFIGAL